MTIGYGVPDPYMNGCWQGPFAARLKIEHVVGFLVLSALAAGLVGLKGCTAMISQLTVGCVACKEAYLPVVASQAFLRRVKEGQ